MSFDWQIAFALELVVVVLGFGLWFKAAKTEAGPKKLGRIAAVVVIILALLMAACTLSKAFLTYKGIKDAKAKTAECTGTCPDCTVGGGAGTAVVPGNSCPLGVNSDRGLKEPCGRATPCGTCLEKNKAAPPPPPPEHKTP